MVRRRPVTLVLAALALVVGGCGTAHANGAHQPKPAPVAQSTAPTDDGQPDPAPSPTGSPSAPGTPAGTPSGPAGPKAPVKPIKGPPTPNGGPAGPHHGPFGSITTTGSAAVALTFDDGPFPYTSEVLDLLAQYHIKATFCVIGRQVAANAALIKRIVAEGHTLCNHTWSHDLSLRLRSEDQIRAEMQKTNDAIHAVVPGVPVKYFREPGGNWAANTVSMAASLGMTSIHWAVDPTDWARPPAQAIINRVLNHTGPGSIVLMHDGGGDRSNTVTALRTILPNLAGRFTLIALPTT
jgi:peptidoglycan/xylan/chitin deacetylase (PgdA/CDA1 family)